MSMAYKKIAQGRDYVKCPPDGDELMVQYEKGEVNYAQRIKRARAGISAVGC